MTPEEVSLLERLVERNAQLRQFVVYVLTHPAAPRELRDLAQNLLENK